MFRLNLAKSMFLFTLMRNQDTVHPGQIHDEDVTRADSHSTYRLWKIIVTNFVAYFTTELDDINTYS